MFCAIQLPVALLLLNLRMKNIVICCDSFPGLETNVSRLHSALMNDKSERQVALYKSRMGEFVGPDGAVSLADQWQLISRLIFASEGHDDVAELYKFLVATFEPDDRLYLFGAGFGAYAVRVLAAALHVYGLLEPGSEERIDYVFRLLLNKPASRSDKAGAHLLENLLRPCKPYFMGLWDTARQLSAFHHFDVPSFSSNPDIQILRHALAIDERRSRFHPALWRSTPNQDVKEVWFSGVHDDVCGGYTEAEAGLSKISLNWMLGEAVRAGLLLDSGKAGTLFSGAGRSAPNALAPLHTSLRGPWWLLEFFPIRIEHQVGDEVSNRVIIPLGRSRSVKPGSSLHATVLERQASLPSYRPHNLPAEFSVTDSLSFLPPERPEVAVEVDSEIEPLPAPKVPGDLVKAIREGECVFYVGAGLPAQSGLPTWQALLRDLLDWAQQNRYIDGVAESLKASLRRGDTSTVADALFHGSGISSETMTQRLREIFLSERAPGTVYQSLLDLRPSAVVTPNFDRLAELMFAPLKGLTLNAISDAEQLQACLTKRQFFVLKLYGDLNRNDTVLFSPEDYREAVSRNLALAEFMDALFVSRTIFFVGASLDGIGDYLRGVMFRTGATSSGPRRHFALVAVTETSWRAKADTLQRRNNIEILPFVPTQGYPQVADFLGQLSKDVSSSSLSPTQPSSSAAPLSKVTLKDVGPFSEFELKLNARWNVLLGDNGVGKSTILKAIAIAICGRDAEAHAERIIKSNRPEATITLETERSTYVTKIARRPNGGVEVKSTPTRALEPEGWLALGFPALRMGVSQASSDLRYVASPIPTTADLLPLPAGEVDPRMTRLKEWIITVDHLAKDDNEKSATTNRYDQMLAKFWTIVEQLTPGIHLKPREIDPRTRKVLVETDDGVIPIESVSQGTTSLVSWVGVLLERLYEVFGDSPDVDPTGRFAIVLIDEIDAHMHPVWQQGIVPALSDLFPKIQFIATTHSPLIVGGMEHRQVARLKRTSNGQIVQIPIRDGMTLGRADQLLTGALFDLESAQDKNTIAALERYTELATQEELTTDEERELNECARKLRVSPPSGAERDLSKQAYAVLSEAIEERLKTVPLEEKSRIETEIKAQIQEGITGSRRQP